MDTDHSDCLFCKIVNGLLPAQKAYEDDTCVAFADIDPKAPVHLLIVPRRHIKSVAEATAEDKELLGHLLWVGSRLAEKHHLAKGYRLTINTGDEGGQTVDHLHVHLLGGRAMHWPPG